MKSRVTWKGWSEWSDCEWLYAKGRHTRTLHCDAEIVLSMCGTILAQISPQGARDRHEHPENWVCIVQKYKVHCGWVISKKSVIRLVSIFKW